MDNIKEQKRKANELRKLGDLEEALIIYRNLWQETEDNYDGAGLLHCLRKLALFDEAISFAYELIVKHPDCSWVKKEVIWTYIQGILDNFDESEPIENILEIAEKIMNLKPDGLAEKMVVFKVLKVAKTTNNWDCVNEWVVKIDPDSLNTNPIKDNSGRLGWSDKSLWYNYRIKGLIEIGKTLEAIDIVDEILEFFPKQRKFFLRFKAYSYNLIGNLPESEKIYKNLCSCYNPEWWLLYEYAKVVRSTGRKEDALKIMYKAAISHSKFESMVKLFFDIGILCKEMEKWVEAMSHLLLCKYVREKKGWSISYNIIKNIEDLNNIMGNKNKPSSEKEALVICRNAWGKILGQDIDSHLSSKRKKIKNDLIGKVKLGRSEKPFCFIISKDNQSFFCFKSDLPSDIKDGNEVIFNAIPSFDKKKNKESWKASNIKHFS